MEDKNSIINKKINSPLAVYVIAYLFGICIGGRSVFKLKYALYLLILLTLITSVLYYLIYIKKTHKMWSLYKPSALCSLLVAGYMNISLSPYAPKNINSNLVKEDYLQNAVLVVKNDVKISRKTPEVICFFKDYNESLLLYLNNTKKIESIQEGDTIVIVEKIKLYEINNYKESNFDYASHMNSKRIFMRAYPNDNSIIVKRRIIKRGEWHIKLKQSVKAIIQKKRERYDSANWMSVMEAILLGEKGNIDNKSRELFSISGTMHIMAVSGLHMGLVYTYIWFFLGIAGNFKYSIIFKTLATISLIWIYCFITGLSPSACRASLMITLSLISRLIYRKNSSLNSLFAAALVITSVEPHNVYDTGFQLSFCAFASILLISPFFLSLLHTKNRFGSYFWQLISITLACQIGTALISITKFGFFPTYFLISNILVLPAATLLLYISVTSLLTDRYDAISGVLDFVVRVLSEYISYTVARIEALPLSSVRLEIGIFDRAVYIILIVIIFFNPGFSQKVRKTIIASLVLVFAFMLIRLFVQ